METPKDMFGTEYKVGDYFVRSGKYTLHFGRVVEIKERSRYGYLIPERNVLLPSIRTVEGTRLRRQAIMERPESHFIIPASAVPSEYLALLLPLYTYPQLTAVLAYQPDTVTTVTYGYSWGNSAPALVPPPAEEGQTDLEYIDHLTRQAVIEHEDDEEITLQKEEGAKFILMVDDMSLEELKDKIKGDPDFVIRLNNLKP